MPVEIPEQNKVNIRLQRQATVKEIKQAVYGEKGEADKNELETVFDEELAALPINKAGLRDAMFKLKYLPDLERKMNLEKVYKKPSTDVILI